MGLVKALVMLGLLVGALVMFNFGWTMYQKEQADVRQAVEAEGTVESTGVEVIVTDDTASFEPVVRYTYMYEGQEYTSKSVYPGPEKRFNSEKDAREVATQYSPGQPVTVFVNQENPTRAFLIKETGGNTVPFGLMGIGALLAVSFGSGFLKAILGVGSGS